MNPPFAGAAVADPDAAPQAPRHPHIPRYLESTYWWAYVHPRAVQTFEREWLVNAILWGNYARLRDHALQALRPPGEPRIGGHTLQVACVYGNLTRKLHAQLAPDARLTVLDILPIQLQNLRSKLPADDGRVRLLHGDSSAMPLPDASVDQALLFFLLHEQPDAVRRATLAEVLRVVKPGGRIVIVDYHRPVRWHPLRAVMAAVFRRLEPYAAALWREEIEAFLPEGVRPAAGSKRTRFGALYQQLVWTR
ncbi:MAG: rhodoquinone biosynthesis methyltransferase RquA [Rubrivivax sp.]|nr:rhodoquinone biosynthesis methyltransferase RquA [Rubrivivax sp.]